MIDLRSPVPRRVRSYGFRWQVAVHLTTVGNHSSHSQNFVNHAADWYLPVRYFWENRLSVCLFVSNSLRVRRFVTTGRPRVRNRRQTAVHVVGFNSIVSSWFCTDENNDFLRVFSEGRVSIVRKLRFVGRLVAAVTCCPAPTRVSPESERKGAS